MLKHQKHWLRAILLVLTMTGIGMAQMTGRQTSEGTWSRFEGVDGWGNPYVYSSIYSYGSAPSGYFRLEVRRYASTSISSFMTFSQGQTSLGAYWSLDLTRPDAENYLNQGWLALHHFSVRNYSIFQAVRLPGGGLWISLTFFDPASGIAETRAGIYSAEFEQAFNQLLRDVK